MILCIRQVCKLEVRYFRECIYIHLGKYTDRLYQSIDFDLTQPYTSVASYTVQPRLSGHFWLVPQYK